MRIFLAALALGACLLAGCDSGNGKKPGDPVGPAQITTPNTPGAPGTGGSGGTGGGGLLKPGGV
jgi:hypothetical protein